MKVIDPKEIRKSLAKFQAGMEELGQDLTTGAARDALADAQARTDRLVADDKAKTAEQLVDDRLEAVREVEIAKLRLSRSESEIAARRWRLIESLNDPGGEVAEDLRENAPLVEKKLIGDLKAILGEDLAGLQRELERVAYRRAEEMYAAARNIEKAKGSPNHAGFILAALPLLEIARQTF